MKKKIVASSAAAVVLLSVSFCAYELGKYQASQAQESNIAYVETSKKNPHLVNLRIKHLIKLVRKKALVQNRLLSKLQMMVMSLRMETIIITTTEKFLTML